MEPLDLAEALWGADSEAHTNTHKYAQDKAGKKRNSRYSSTRERPRSMAPEAMIDITMSNCHTRFGLLAAMTTTTKPATASTASRSR